VEFALMLRSRPVEWVPGPGERVNSLTGRHFAFARFVNSAVINRVLISAASFVIS
jgi:hypothetical protein